MADDPRRHSRGDRAAQDQLIAQSANWDVLGGVNFRKGCYTGQEIIARMQYLGRLKERLFAFHADAATIPAGARVFGPAFGDQAVRHRRQCGAGPGRRQRPPRRRPARCRRSAAGSTSTRRTARARAACSALRRAARRAPARPRRDLQNTERDVPCADRARRASARTPSSSPPIATSIMRARRRRPRGGPKAGSRAAISTPAERGSRSRAPAATRSSPMSASRDCATRARRRAARSSRASSADALAPAESVAVGQRIGRGVQRLQPASRATSRPRAGVRTAPPASRALGRAFTASPTPRSMRRGRRSCGRRRRSPRGARDPATDIEALFAILADRTPRAGRAAARHRRFARMGAAAVLALHRRRRRGLRHALLDDRHARPRRRRALRRAHVRSGGQSRSARSTSASR